MRAAPVLALALAACTPGDAVLGPVDADVPPEEAEADAPPGGDEPAIGDSAPVDGCGSEGRTFVVTVTDGFVLPYKPASGAPWDWDGDLPNWMVDVVDVVGAITRDPTVVTAAEILDVVDRLAPRLLDGTTPPDPVLVASTALAGEGEATTVDGVGRIGVDAAGNDTYEPAFAVRAEVSLADDEVLRFDVKDDDVIGQDRVGAVVLGLEDLRAHAGCGPGKVRGDGGLYFLGFEVVAR